MYIIVIAVVVVGVWLFMRKGSGGADLYTTTASPSVSASPSATLTNTSTPVKTQTLPDGLKIEDMVMGTGAPAKAGQKVTVHYTGWLTNGTKFDSSVDRGTPFAFNLGAGEVIKGWDEGVAGMQVGGKRRLTIPAALGYGEAGAGGGVIPPNATLIFDVQLIAIQ